MKTKIIITIAALAVVALSFTLKKSDSELKKMPATSTASSHSEPAGGFVQEDKF